MTQRVVAGEPILPNMTARWFNQTLDKTPPPPPQRKSDLRHHNEDVATFVPTELCTKAERFTAVAPLSQTDTLGNFVARSQYVNKEGLSKSNWIITQAEMGTGYKTQPCVYAGVTYAKVKILSTAHRYVDLNLDTLELESATSGKGLLLSISEPYSFISIESYDVRESRPQPDPRDECYGECKYEAVDLGWQLTQNLCSTTTSTSTSTSDDSTTTYHDQDCRIVAPSLPEKECVCQEPTFCPTANGQCTYTSCSKLEPRPISCPSTTSTSTTTTPCDCDTTTTGAPGDNNTCTFTFTNNGTPVLLSNNCPPGCECYVVESGDPCVPSVVGCICPPVEPDVPCECAGDSLFFCDGDTWRPLSNTCQKSGSCDELCVADTPQAPCTDCGGLLRVPCSFTSLPSTSSTTTGDSRPCSSPCDFCYGCPTTIAPTTTTGDACDALCLKKWNGTVWETIYSLCNSPCQCSDVPYERGETCEVVSVACTGSTSTTTTGCGGGCIYQAFNSFGGMFWFALSNNCVDVPNCDCPPYPVLVCGNPTEVGATCVTPCGNYPTTTTTSTTTSSTTSSTTTTTTTTTTSTTSSTSTTTTCSPTCPEGFPDTGPTVLYTAVDGVCSLTSDGCVGVGKIAYPPCDGCPGNGGTFNGYCCDDSTSTS